MGHALHSRVDWEGDGDAAEWSARFTSSKNEELTPLARSVLSGASAAQHRDALGEADCARMAIMAEVPLEELQVRCLTPTPPRASSDPRRVGSQHSSAAVTIGNPALPSPRGASAAAAHAARVA